MHRYDDEIHDAQTGTGSAERDREARLRRRRYARPPVDIFTTEAEITVLADTPGAVKSDLQVTLEGDELVIEAPVRGRAEEESGLPWGYYRRFKLRTAFDREGIHARLEGGVLEIKLPKADSQRAKRVAID